jgi:predicted ATPase/class 3 adenylate cyclase
MIYNLVVRAGKLYALLIANNRHGAPMQQIAEWLAKIGLERYAAAFADNDIDVSVLGYLTDADLEKIGVSLGHRRRLLAAIAEIAGAKATPAHPPTETPERQAAERRELAASLAAGERRYLTVMFCDLVGSTSISAKLDAEEWRDLVGAYLDAASAAVAELGGHVAKKLGDGLLALFGYPLAHENDAERAARAALLIQRALAELNAKNAGIGKPELSIRIGLETGPAVLDAAGEIYGDVANVAARVQALAEPGAILITARVQRQLAGLFVAEDRGRHELKGVPEPVTLFHLVRASGGGRRARQRHLTPLIGREEEIAVLNRRWERARQGDGQLLLIVGEPGVGKSRLIEEFHAGLHEAPHSWVEWTCSQLLQNTPLHPIAEWGRQRFGSAETPAEQRLADLENSLAQVKLDKSENAALLAPLLDIPLPQERAPALPPEQFRRRQLAAMSNWIMAGARSQPVLLALEDIHWADPTTLDLLSGIAERGVLAPLFVVITARPEFRPPWGTRSHHSTISLSPLDRRQVREMISELAARHALAKEIIDNVTERSGGVPLFVEEVTRLLLERGERGGVQAIPPTLQQSLMARLDRLGPAREVAHIGAVIGRDFSYALLHDVAGIDDTPLQAALERLAEADILLVQGLPPEADYRFKHALVQDAAYENMLKSRRRVLHRRVAEMLRVAVRVAVEPELLAHHFTQAGLTEDAIEWWGKAGRRSVERSALFEAVAQFTRALDQMETLPGTPALRREQISLQVALIAPLIHVKGYAALETKAAVERARLLIEQAEALGEPPEDPLLLFVVLYGIWTAAIVAFTSGDAVRQLAAQFLTLAEKQGGEVPLMIGHRLMGVSLLLTGNLVESRDHFDRSVALYDPVQHRALAARFGHDIGAAILAFRSLVQWLLGYGEGAAANADQALEIARNSGQVGTLMYVLFFISPLHLLAGNYATAAAQAQELLALAEEKLASLWIGGATTFRGCILALTGKPSDAVQLINSGLATWQGTGATFWLPLYESYLAKAHAELGKFVDAWRCIGEAARAVETTKETMFEAEVYRIAGEIALKEPQPDAAKAQGYFERALSVARKQQAKSFELRAAMSMARLWRDQGKRDAARDLLAPVCNWFTEGFDALDLKEAKALLAELAS